jgi:hypothetical protein
MKEVVHHGALPDIHGIGVQSALQQVRAERAHAHGQREKDCGDNDPVHTSAYRFE